MTEIGRRDWIIPVLDDIRNFLHETDRDDFAQDITVLIDKYEPLLRAEAEKLIQDNEDKTKIVDLATRRSQG